MVINIFLKNSAIFMKKCRNINESYEEKLLDNNSESLNGHDVMQPFNFLYLINHLDIDAK